MGTVSYTHLDVYKRQILEMAEYKKEGRLKALIVTGCLAQRYRQEILDEIPEVDAVLGTTAYDKILDAIDEALKGHHTLTLADTDLLPEVETKRLVTTGGHFAYLKIAEGCDKHCTSVSYTHLLWISKEISNSRV